MKKEIQRVIMYALINIFFIFLFFMGLNKIQALQIKKNKIFKNIKLMRKEIQLNKNYKKIVGDYKTKLKIIKELSEFLQPIDAVIYISDLLKKEGIKPVSIRQLEDENSHIIDLKIRGEYKIIMNILEKFASSSKLLMLKKLSIQRDQKNLLLHIEFKINIIK